MDTTSETYDDVWWLGALLRIRATKEQTGGAYTLVEEHLPHGFATPVHVHEREEEAFLVLGGAVDFWIGDAPRHGAEAGSFVFLPRDVPHAFRVESEEAHVLMIATPGGMEAFFRAAGDRAEAPVIPPPLDGPPDMARLIAASGDAGVRVLGPPPASGTDRLDLEAPAPTPAH
jgi:quercetin dioxygenase-like cupin family protein